MGNKQSQSTVKFNKMITEMKKEQNLKVNIHPEKKYLMLMMEQIGKSKLPTTLRQMVMECLSEKLTPAELIQSISCINALRNNQFQVTQYKGTSFLREKPESKFVKINFGEGFLSKILHKIGINVNVKGHYLQQPNLEETHEHSMDMQESKVDDKHHKKDHLNKHKKEDQGGVRQRLKNITSVMKKQLNRISHPFGKLNKSFAEYMHEYYPTFLRKFKTEDEYQKSVRETISQWCSYLQSSCLNPYKKWIINYSGIQELKYTKWIKGLILQQIWAVNNGYLFSMLAIVINSRKTKLGIDFKQLQYNAALLTPTLFNIDSKLQIQGHFFDSIYQMSEVVSKVRPQQIISQLQTVKKRVCTDIDNYHRLNQRGQIYEIDSDNILGIVSYILCKISSRIDEIHTCLIFLRVIYGDNIYFTMGISSYMLSTIFGAIQFLESEQFREMINVKHSKISNVIEDTTTANKSETKGTLSQKQEIQDKAGQENLINKQLLSSSLLIVAKSQKMSNI